MGEKKFGGHFRSFTNERKANDGRRFTFECGTDRYNLLIVKGVSASDRSKVFKTNRLFHNIEFRLVSASDRSKVIKTMDTLL